MGKQTMYITTTRHEGWKGPKRWLRLVVHDTLEELQEYARKRWDHKDPPSILGFYAPPVYKERYDEKTDKWINTSNPHFGGAIHMAKTHLTFEITAHESMHAAAQIYRMDMHTTVHLGAECNYREEGLAYMVGDISNLITMALVENGCFETHDDTDEWEPGRWWSVWYEDEAGVAQVWCETSDEEEARGSMRPGDTLYRQYRIKEATKLVNRSKQ